MNKYRLNKFFKYIAIFSITVFISVSFILNLNVPVLGDEAETVLLADSIVNTGWPKLDYNKHPFSNELGFDIGKFGVDIIHSWLPHYFAAAQIVIFDLINIPLFEYRTLRLESFFLTLLTFYLSFWLTYKLRRNLLVSVLVSSLIFLNNNILLYLFSIRYYVFSSLFLTTLLISLIKIQERKTSQRDFLLASLSLVGSYYSHWPTLIVLLPYTLAYLLSIKIKPKYIIFVFIITTILIVPHYLYFNPIKKYTLFYNRFELLLSRQHWIILKKINTYLFPGILLVVLSSFYTLFRKNKFFSLVAFSAFTLIGLAVINTQTLVFPRERYYILLLPLYMLLITYVITSIKVPFLKFVIHLTIITLSIYIALLTFPKFSNYNSSFALINWINQHIPVNSSIYVNFDRRDILLHTKLKVKRAYDFQATETGIYSTLYNHKLDPSYQDMNNIDYILWNQCSDINARTNKSWLTEYYISVRVIQDNFKIIYKNNCHLIYKNDYSQI